MLPLESSPDLATIHHSGSHAAHPGSGADRALRACAETGAAILGPQPVIRDAELFHVNAEAGCFFQSLLTRSRVSAYLASRPLDAALLPAYAGQQSTLEMNLEVAWFLRCSSQ